MIRLGSDWIPLCPCCKREAKPQGKNAKWPILCPDCALHVDVHAGLSVDECTYEVQTGRRCPFAAAQVVCQDCHTALDREAVEAAEACPFCGADITLEAIA
jgi:hypothetical protein